MTAQREKPQTGCCGGRGVAAEEKSMTRRTWRIRSWSALWITVGMGAGTASADPIFYGVTGSNLVRFDMGAGTVSVVAPVTAGSPLNLLEDCDFDGAGNLWAVRQGNAGGFPPTSVCQAYRVDTLTGNSVPGGNF